MPVIVIGADSEVGSAVVRRLQSRAGEIRAFVSDRSAGAALRETGVKVATGDVSDLSHVGGAAAGAFSAVLITAAPTDGRETAFLDPRRVVEGWIGALAEARVHRIIVVGDAPPALPAAPETVVVPTAGRDPAQVAVEVAEWDDAARL